MKLLYEHPQLEICTLAELSICSYNFSYPRCNFKHGLSCTSRDHCFLSPDFHGICTSSKVSAFPLCTLLVFLISSKLWCQCPADGFEVRICRSKDFSAFYFFCVCHQTFMNCALLTFLIVWQLKHVERNSFLACFSKKSIILHGNQIVETFFIMEIW